MFPPLLLGVGRVFGGVKDCKPYVALFTRFARSGRNKSVFVELKDCKPHVVHLLITLIQKGEASVSSINDLASLFILAQKFECRSFILAQIQFTLTHVLNSSPLESLVILCRTDLSDTLFSLAASSISVDLADKELPKAAVLNVLNRLGDGVQPLHSSYFKTCLENGLLSQEFVERYFCSMKLQPLVSLLTEKEFIKILTNHVTSLEKSLFFYARYSNFDPTTEEKLQAFYEELPSDVTQILKRYQPFGRISSLNYMCVKLTTLYNPKAKYPEILQSCFNGSFVKLLNSCGDDQIPIQLARAGVAEYVNIAPCFSIVQSVAGSKMLRTQQDLNNSIGTFLKALESKQSVNAALAEAILKTTKKNKEMNLKVIQQKFLQNKYGTGQEFLNDVKALLTIVAKSSYFQKSKVRSRVEWMNTWLNQTFREEKVQSSSKGDVGGGQFNRQITPPNINAAQHSSNNSNSTSSAAPMTSPRPPSQDVSTSKGPPKAAPAASAASPSSTPERRISQERRQSSSNGSGGGSKRPSFPASNSSVGGRRASVEGKRGSVSNPKPLTGILPSLLANNLTANQTGLTAGSSQNTGLGAPTPRSTVNNESPDDKQSTNTGTSSLAPPNNSANASSNNSSQLPSSSASPSSSFINKPQQPSQP